MDALDAVGLDALAQVDVGVRHHRHQDGQALGRMAATIYRTALDRLDRTHRLKAEDGLVRPLLTQFTRDPATREFTAHTHPVSALERPPMRTVPEYLQGR